MMDELHQPGYQRDHSAADRRHARSTTASVKKAESKGIPVITLNTDTKLPHAACVSMDDEGAGYLVGEQIGKALGGKGNVAIISRPGAQAGVEREKELPRGEQLFPNQDRRRAKRRLEHRTRRSRS